MKKATPKPMEAKDPQLTELEAQYGTIHIIEGKSEDGKELVMYLRKPDYNTKKAALETIMSNSKALAAAGEMILLACYVGGDNLYDSEDTRLEASYAATELVKFNSTIALKKN